MRPISDILGKYKDRRNLRRIVEKMKGYSMEGGISYPTIAAQMNRNSDQQFQLRHAVPLMLATEDFSLLHHMAEACHCVCMPLPEMEESKHMHCFGQSVALMSHEFSDALNVCVAAWADGEIDEEERVECKREIYELIHAASMLLVKLKMHKPAAQTNETEMAA